MSTKISYYSLIILVIYAVSLVSCNPKNLKKKDVLKNSVSKNIVQEVLNNNLIYETLRIKGKCSYKNGKNTTQFTYRVHIEKGKKIWASLSGLGIEAVRVLIQGDSAAFFNRLEQTYWKGNIQELNQKLGIQGNINILESILIGNFFQNQVEKIVTENNQTQFITSLDKIPLLIRLTPEQKVQHIKVNAPQNGWKSELNYENFQVLYNKLIPFKIAVSIQEPQNVQAYLEHKEIEVNPKDLKFTFQIPDDYKFVPL
ncbi:MAG: hypothetical protein KatS3mg035_1473 [Bacteroidia bacterium]|nr:MAG: hypothetical protein KatS3mg035_1473 [Bacteroidia bacterium]